MSTALPQLMCKVCGKVLPAQAVMSARKGHAAKCECGAAVRLSAVPMKQSVANQAVGPRGGGGSPAQATRAPSKAKPMVVAGLEEDSYRCPSCNAAMAPGTVLCVGCGFNLNTGQHLAASRGKTAAAKPSPGAKRAASAFGVPAPHRMATVTEDRTGQINQVLIAVAGMLLLLGAVMGGRLAWNHFNRPTNYLGDDGKVAELMDDSGGTEIHAWFAQDPSRLAGGYSATQATALADSLQHMGARQVLAFGSRMTRVLAIELPDNPEQRKALFARENEYELQHFEKPSKDVGQHYLLMNLGL
jgi:hypothetical protein